MENWCRLRDGRRLTILISDGDSCPVRGDSYTCGIHASRQGQDPKEVFIYLKQQVIGDWYRNVDLVDILIEFKDLTRCSIKVQASCGDITKTI